MFGKRDKPAPNEPPTPPEPSGHADGGPAPSETHDETNVPDAMAYEKLLEDLANVTLDRDKAKADYLRALAEYQNYQRRSVQNEAEAKRQGVTSVLTSVLPVIDHFDMALTQRVDTDAAQRVLDGVKVIKTELLRALEKHGVGVISPALGDEPDHSRHSVLMHQECEGVAPGRISSVMQVGYTLGERVIRPAMVTVAPADPDAVTRAEL